MTFQDIIVYNLIEHEGCMINMHCDLDSILLCSTGYTAYYKINVIVSRYELNVVNAPWRNGTVIPSSLIIDYRNRMLNYLREYLDPGIEDML